MQRALHAFFCGMHTAALHKEIAIPELQMRKLRFKAAKLLSTVCKVQRQDCIWLGFGALAGREPGRGVCVYCGETNNQSRWGARQSVRRGEDSISDRLSTRRKEDVEGENSTRSGG